MIICATNSSWVKLVSSYIVTLLEVSALIDHMVFSVLSNKGKRIPKKYTHSMITVKLQFSSVSQILKHLHN